MLMTTMYVNSTIPAQVLEEIFEKNLSGCLVISDPKDKSVRWELYLNSNLIYYATSLVGKNQRLACLWKQFEPNLTAPEFVSENFDYHQLCNWWLSKKLPQSDLQELLFKLTQEVLAQIITFGSTSIDFFPDRSVGPIILNCSWRELLKKPESLSYQWQQLRSHVFSPFSRIYLDTDNLHDFYNFWKQLDKKTDDEKFFRTKKLSFWLKLLSEKPDLYVLLGSLFLCTSS